MLKICPYSSVIKYNSIFKKQNNVVFCGQKRSIKNKSEQINFSCPNINFTSLSDFEALQDTYLVMQDRINSTNCIDIVNPNVALTSFKDVENLNNLFIQNNIGKIISSRISLNLALTYLAKKGQIDLNGNNCAFMIDRLSLRDTDALDRALSDNSTFFYCYAENNKQANELINKFTKIAGADVPVKKIIKQSQKNSVKGPSQNDFLKTIIAMSKYRFPDDIKKQKEFMMAMLKYIKEFFTPFSYASICKNLETLYLAIIEKAKKMGKTEDDVIYIYPDTVKSYLLINYLFAMQNDINQDKFMSFSEAKKNYDCNKVYVVLDDLCLTGASASDVFNSLKGAGDDIKMIFAPILNTEYSIPLLIMADNERKQDGQKTVVVPAIHINDLGTADYLNTSLGDCFYDYKNIDEYMSRFKYLTKNDVDYLLKNLRGKYLGATAISLPYMIPDNSSDVMAMLGEYFLNRNSLTANKGIESEKSHEAAGKLKLKEYLEIKKIMGDD